MIPVLSVPLILVTLVRWALHNGEHVFAPGWSGIPGPLSGSGRSTSRTGVEGVFDEFVLSQDQSGTVIDYESNVW